MERLRRASAAFVVLAVGLLLSALLRGAARTPDGMRTIAEHRAWEMGGICVAFATLAVAGALLLPGSPRARLGLRRGRLPARAVLVLAIGMLAFSHAVDAGIALWGGLQKAGVARSPHDAELVRGWVLAGTLAGTALAPAVGEELLYRGLVQRSVVPWVGGRAAVVLAALVFGAVHRSPVHAAAAALLGLYLGAVVQWADSVRPAIVCHALNNAVAALATIGVLAGSVRPSFSAPAGLLLGSLCLLWVYRNLPSGKSLPESREPPLQPSAQSDDG